jgi:DNA invertase Pin-like site-specific DNA recombinase
VVARNETEMRVERQVLGHQRRRESGRPFWGTRPFGFERDGRHREAEAEALRRRSRRSEPVPVHARRALTTRPACSHRS